MVVEKNQKITLIYTLKDGNGQFIERADSSNPLVYLHGYNYILPPLEQALEGRKLGEKFNVKIDCEEAFGPYQHDLLMVIPRKELQDIENLEVGMEVEMVQDGLELTEKRDMFWVPQTPEDLFKDPDPGDPENEEEEEDPEVFTVREIRDNEVVLDGNAYLAGRDLIFDVEIIEIEPASFEEIEEMYLNQRDEEGPEEGLF